MDIYDKAMNWIRRWKLVGGGFEVTLGLTGPEVQLLRRVDPDEKIDAIAARTASQIERHLREKPALHAAVCELAVEAWKRRAVANDTEPEPPEAA